MKTLIATIIIAVAILAVLGSASWAQGVQCGKREVMVKVLETKFREKLFAIAMSSPRNMIEIYLSKKGTWTILATSTTGTSCVISAGKHWMNMPVGFGT